MYTEKQSMMVVHANPNTHPDGVQGALLRFAYHSELTPTLVNSPPTPSAAKFRKRNNKIRNSIPETFQKETCAAEKGCILVLIFEAAVK